MINKLHNNVLTKQFNLMEISISVAKKIFLLNKIPQIQVSQTLGDFQKYVRQILKLLSTKYFRIAATSIPVLRGTRFALIDIVILVY